MDRTNEQFSEIYDKYIEKIYRFVYLKVSSKETAEDITSRVFLRGLEFYQKKEEILNPGAFLYQVARNMVIDHYREKDRTKTVSVDFIPTVIDPKSNIHEKAIFNSEVEEVKIALANIKKDYQDVIIWHYLEDMPVGQIAEIIGKPVGTVRVMIHRGLSALKNEINKKA